MYLGMVHNVQLEKLGYDVISGVKLKKLISKGKLQLNSEHNRKCRITFQWYEIDEKFKQITIGDIRICLLNRIAAETTSGLS
jgi:lipopolysaccharide export system protein LptA